jgi:hypothetical protein
MILATLCVFAVLIALPARAAEVSKAGSADASLAVPSCGTVEEQAAARGENQRQPQQTGRSDAELRGRSDLNGDEEITMDDLMLLLSAWGNCPPWSELDCLGDINGDYIVDLADLMILLGFLDQPVVIEVPVGSANIDVQRAQLSPAKEG